MFVTLQGLIFILFILGAIFFGVAALADLFKRGADQERGLFQSVANLQVGLVCLAVALGALVPGSWLLLCGGLAVLSGALWLGYALHQMLW